MHENEKEIYKVQFSMMFSNLSCSHISDNLRAWHSTPPHRGVSFVTGFSLFLLHTVFSLPVLSACRMPFPPFLPFFSSFNITELFYPTCLWSFIDLPSWAEGLILLSPPLELGSDIQATKALNGTCPHPGSSSARALMLQPLPSRSFLLKEPLCFSYNFQDCYRTL